MPRLPYLSERLRVCNFTNNKSRTTFLNTITVQINYYELYTFKSSQILSILIRFSHWSQQETPKIVRKTNIGHFQLLRLILWINQAHTSKLPFKLQLNKRLFGFIHMHNCVLVLLMVIPKFAQAAFKSLISFWSSCSEFPKQIQVVSA